MSNAAADGQQIKIGQSGYEWWYFDVLDERRDLALVVIFYCGNPFSRRMYAPDRLLFKESAVRFPGISISLHRKGKPLFLGFQEFDAEMFHHDGNSLTFGNNTLVMHQDFWSLQIDLELPSGLALRGRIRFGKCQDGWFEPRSEPAAHSWNLASVRAEVSGTLALAEENSVVERFEIKGTGYHDHNWGIRPLHRDFNEWSWGRFHLEGASIVYYYKKLASGVFSGSAWLFDQNRGTAIPLQIKPDSYRRALFGFLSPRQITLQGEGFHATVYSKMVLETGPFYQRFIARVDAEHHGKTQVVSAITEFIQASNIHKVKFRWLAEMRITYPGRKPHWVQRSHFLYRKTWL